MRWEEILLRCGEARIPGFTSQPRPAQTRPHLCCFATANPCLIRRICVIWKNQSAITLDSRMLRSILLFKVKIKRVPANGKRRMPRRPKPRGFILRPVLLGMLPKNQQILLLMKQPNLGERNGPAQNLPPGPGKVRLDHGHQGCQACSAQFGIFPSTPHAILRSWRCCQACTGCMKE